MSKMHCSEYVKSKGLRSLKSFSEKCGIVDSTLKVWYVKKRYLFDALLEKVVREEKEREENE